MVLLFALIAGCARAQKDPAAEIHGVVTEVGLKPGLAGAEVTLFEFAGPDRVRTFFATTATDMGGEFRFHPERFGDYWVEVKKQSYFAAIPIEGLSSLPKPLSETTGTLVSVNAGIPSQEVRLTLIRPGELTGSVIDENDKPLPKILVEVTTAGSPLLSSVIAHTDADGSFTVNNLIPGEYLVKLSPALNGSVTVMPQFSEDDLKAVDQTLETVYWPGAPDERSATPARVIPGASATLGTIRMRKTVSYRARVSMTGCQPDDLPSFGVAPSSGGGPMFVLNVGGKIQTFNGLAVTSCQDFLVKGLKPGSYTFRLSSQRTWAAAPVEVTSRNPEVALTMAPGMNVTGRVVAGEDVTLPPLDKLRVTLTGTEFAHRNSVSLLDEKGGFGAKDLWGTSHRVQLSGLGDKYYVKEIRVDGRATPEGAVTLQQGSKLEIEIDDQPAAIAGSVTDGDKPFSQPLIFAARWPSLEAPFRPATGDNNGRFQITGLPPGEYRILAVQSAPLPDGQQIGSQMLTQLWSSAEKVTLERGGAQSVSLKLSDPMR
jgi:hypothetical protein